MHKKVFAFVIAIAVSLHILCLIALHNYHFSPVLGRHSSSLNFFTDHTYQMLQRKERSALLSQAFQNLQEAPKEIKEELHELIPEFSPSLLISFPEGEPALTNDDSFSLETEPIEVCLNDTYTFIDGNPLITLAPELISSEMPMLEEFDQETDFYTGSGTLASSDHFDVQVEYTPRQDRPGYVFKLTFYPKMNVVFKRISQNYYFLIDRSNSISRGRFIVNKRIVADALEYLKPRDTFNILIFDDKVTKFAETNQLWNEDSVARAREFLKAQGHGGYFAATELYSSLGKVIPTQVSDQEVNTAILLSDGDSYLTADKQRQIIGGWTHQNGGKVSLFSVASGNGNNLPLLDLISSFNKGALVYSSDHFELSNSVCNLIKSIRNPIGKKMTATAIPTDRQMMVMLQPKKERLPYLYKNSPFVLYGCTNRLSDFVVFLQGNFYDSRFDIKKRITFSNAKLGSPGIERAWTQLLVQEFYERYFHDGDIQHVEEAKKLLTPLNLPVPFLNLPQ
ncbi:MAG: VWA domain-containing protein [Chlamydiales bacterium]|nr:VWA domain-containing protein [Chlamydiales bacterium]